MAQFSFIAFTFALAMLCCHVSQVNSVDVFSLWDQRCLARAPEPVQPNFDWAGKVGTWYLNAGSRLHLYRTSADLARVSVSAVAEHDLYYKSCLRFVWGQSTVVNGFGGKETDVAMTPNDDGTFSFRYSNLGLDGRATVVLTDNESFVMFYVCWPHSHGNANSKDSWPAGNDASWAVISQRPELSEKAKASVHKVAVKLGFDERQFSELRYDSCKL